eukprot:2627189-Alexandrium_andersonii.AAC.1
MQTPNTQLWEARTRLTPGPNSETGTPRRTELRVGGTTLRAAPPRPRNESCVVPVSSEFWPWMKLFRAVRALSPQHPAARCRAVSVVD